MAEKGCWWRERFGEKGDLNPEQRRYAVSGFTNLVWLTCMEHWAKSADYFCKQYTCLTVFFHEAWNIACLYLDWWDVLNSGKTDSVGGEPSPISTAGEFAYRKCYGDALHEEGSSPGSITSCEQQISVESPRQSKQSGLLQELLLMSTENSYDSGEEIPFLQGTMWVPFCTANLTAIYL